MAFESGVNAPTGVSYAAPLMSFQDIGEWGNAYQQGTLNRQQQQTNVQQQALNQQRIEAGQRQAEIAQTFKGGLPIDPATGAIDYKKAVAMLAQKGDNSALWSGADAVLSQGAANLSPLLMGGTQPGQGQPQPSGTPASIPAKPLPPPAQNSPQGDPGKGTIASIVTDRLPGQDAVTGQTIVKVAQVMGVDPNATLTPGQLRRAQGLVQKYAPAAAAAAPVPAAPAAQPDGGATFKDRFAAAGGDAGNLPPSANAVSPAPKAAPVAQPAPIGAASPAQPPATVVPQAPPVAAAPAAAPPAAHPITPQVPLPKGFSDPQAAILALRTEAARLSVNPRAAGQAEQLTNWAHRIEQSIASVDVNPNTTRIDPATGRVLYQGPAAASLAATLGAEGSATIDADAETYRKTGKLPTNMGRGIQGAAEARLIRQRATEQEIAEGGNPAEWANRWQSFGAQASGKRILEQRAAGLSLAENEASSLLPRVREASARVSRTNYPTLNSIILASSKGSGGTDVIKLGVALESLVPVYARVLKPVGGLAQGDLSRAHELLDKAWSDGQINAALDQMEVELKSARTALDKTMSESDSRGRKNEPAQKTEPSKAPKAQGTLKSGLKWSVE